VVSKCYVIGFRVYRLEDLKRVWTVPDYIAESDDAVSLAGTDVEEDGLPRLEVGVDV